MACTIQLLLCILASILIHSIAARPSRRSDGVVIRDGSTNGWTNSERFKLGLPPKRPRNLFGTFKGP